MPEVELADLKEQAKIINPFLGEEKVKVVDIPYTELKESFSVALEELNDRNGLVGVPASVIEMFNFIHQESPHIPKKLTWKTFQDFKDIINNSDLPTHIIDRLLVDGGTLDEIFTKFKEELGDRVYKKIKQPKDIKIHINYRKGKGIIVTVNGDIGNPVYKFVNYI